MRHLGSWLVVFLMMLAGASAWADESDGAGVPVAPPAGSRVASERALAQEDRIAELERTVKVLASELERTRSEIAVPEEPELAGKYRSAALRSPCSARTCGRPPTRRDDTHWRISRSENST